MSRVIAIDTPSTRLQVQQQKTTLQIAQIFERAVTIEKTENTITVVPQSSYTVLELHNDEIRIEPVQAVTHIEIAQGLQGEKGDKGDPGSGVMVWQGSYDAAVTYSENDGVSYAGSSYICTTESTGNLPTDTDYWISSHPREIQGGRETKVRPAQPGHKVLPVPMVRMELRARKEYKEYRVLRERTERMAPTELQAHRGSRVQPVRKAFRERQERLAHKDHRARLDPRGFKGNWTDWTPGSAGSDWG